MARASREMEASTFNAFSQRKREGPGVKRREG